MKYGLIQQMKKNARYMCQLDILLNIVASILSPDTDIHNKKLEMTIKYCK